MISVLNSPEYEALWRNAIRAVERGGLPDTPPILLPACPVEPRLASEGYLGTLQTLLRQMEAHSDRIHKEFDNWLDCATLVA